MFYMNFQVKPWLLVAVSTILFITSCKKDKETESELITKVVVRLTGIASSFDQSFEAVDADGDGVFNSIDTIELPVDGAYSCYLSVLDETKSPVEDITEEIKEENTAHLVVYKSSLNGLAISINDKDDNGAPLGLYSNWVVTEAGTSAVQISLHHEPTDKTATDPGGEIDFSVTFPLKVQ